jgi:antitoxin ParD1/3/4
MDTMNIAIPSSLKQFVQERVSGGGYGSVSEYVRELIRADQKRAARERIEAEVLKGLDSGDPVEMTADDWKSIREEVIRRHTTRNVLHRFAIGAELAEENR